MTSVSGLETGVSGAGRLEENPYSSPQSFEHVKETGVDKLLEGIKLGVFPGYSFISEYRLDKDIEQTEWGAPFSETFRNALPQCCSIEAIKAMGYGLIGTLCYYFLS